MLRINFKSDEEYAEYQRKKAARDEVMRAQQKICMDRHCVNCHQKNKCVEASWGLITRDRGVDDPLRICEACYQEYSADPKVRLDEICKAIIDSGNTCESSNLSCRLIHHASLAADPSPVERLLDRGAWASKQLWFQTA